MLGDQPCPLLQEGLGEGKFLQPAEAPLLNPGPFAAAGWGRGAEPHWSLPGPLAEPEPGPRPGTCGPTRADGGGVLGAPGKMIVAGTAELQEGDHEEVLGEAKPQFSPDSKHLPDSREPESCGGR